MQNDNPAIKSALKPHLLSGWRFLVLVLSVLITAVGYLLFTFWGGWEEVTSAISRFGFGGIALALTLSSFNYVCRYLRWQYLFHLLGHKVPSAKGLAIYLAGFSLTITPSKAGEAIRNVFLTDYGVPHRQSLGVMLAERFADMIAVVLLAAMGFFSYAEGQSAIGITVALLLFGLYALQRDSWLKAVERGLNRALPARFTGGIDFFVETILHLRTCFTLKPLLIGILLALFAWSAEGYAFYTLIHLLGYETPLYLALFIFAFSLLVGTVTFLPGGLGGTEVAMLNLLLLQGVEFSDAVAITIVFRLCTLWYSVLLGLITLPMNRVRIQ